MLVRCPNSIEIYCCSSFTNGERTAVLSNKIRFEKISFELSNVELFAFKYGIRPAT